MSRLFSKRAQILSVYTQDRLLSFCEHCKSMPRFLQSSWVKSFDESRGFYGAIVARAKQAKRFNKRDAKIVAVAVEPIAIRSDSSLGPFIAIGFVSFRLLNHFARGDDSRRLMGLSDRPGKNANRLG